MHYGFICVIGLEEDGMVNSRGGIKSLTIYNSQLSVEQRPNTGECDEKIMM